VSGNRSRIEGMGWVVAGDRAIFFVKLRLLLGVKIEGLSFGAVMQLPYGFDADSWGTGQTQMLKPLSDKGLRGKVKQGVLTGRRLKWYFC
jgi:hypothetical protein